MKNHYYVFLFLIFPFVLAGQISSCNGDQSTHIYQWDWTQVEVPMPYYDNNQSFAGGTLRTNINYDPDGIKNCQGENLLSFVVNPTKTNTLPCDGVDCSEGDDLEFSERNFRSEIRILEEEPFPEGSEHWVGWNYYFPANIEEQLDEEYTIFQNRRDCNDNEPAFEIIIAGDVDEDGKLFGVENVMTGDILILNKETSNSTGGKGWETDVNVIGIESLNIIVHVIFGTTEDTGLLEVWLNGGEPVHSQQAPTIADGCEEGGNYHFGIYAHQWDSVSNPPDDPNDPLELNDVAKVLFMGELSLVTHCPETSTWNLEDFTALIGGTTAPDFGGCNMMKGWHINVELDCDVAAQYENEVIIDPEELVLGGPEFIEFPENIGLRFQNLPPRLNDLGERLIIDGSYIQLTAAGEEAIDNEDCLTMEILIELDGDASCFIPEMDNFSSRVLFEPDPRIWWSLSEWIWCNESPLAGAGQRTRDLTILLQEVIDSGTYPDDEMGNVVFVLKNHGNPGLRIAESENPRLILQFRYVPNCIGFTSDFSVDSPITEPSNISFSPEVEAPDECSIESVIYDFGDGNIVEYSEGEPVFHPNPECRSYRVCQTVTLTGENCQDCKEEVCKTIDFEPNYCCTPSLDECESGLEANFISAISSYNSGYPPMPVYIGMFFIEVLDHNTVECPRVKVTWNYGDGTECIVEEGINTDPDCGIFPNFDQYSYHYFDAPGYYQVCVEIEDACGCIDCYCEVIQVDEIEGEEINIFIQSSENVNAWEIYPNPALNKLQFSNPGSTILSATIYNTSGLIDKVVSQSEIENIEIDIGNLSSGYHFIQFELLNEPSVVKQFIKAN